MRRRDAELIGQLRGGEPDADEAATGTKPDPRFDDLRVADEQAADAQLPWGCGRSRIRPTAQSLTRFFGSAA